MKAGRPVCCTTGAPGRSKLLPSLRLARSDDRDSQSLQGRACGILSCHFAEPRAGCLCADGWCDSERLEQHCLTCSSITVHLFQGWLKTNRIPASGDAQGQTPASAKQMNLTPKEHFSLASKAAASDEISVTSNKCNDGSFLPPMATWCWQLLFQRLVTYQEMPLANCSDSQNSIWKENKSKCWVPSCCFSCSCPSQVDLSF